MNKCHTPLNWQNDTTPAINDTNLNYMDGCIETIDDRVVAMDTAKLESEDIANVIKAITFDDTTGIFTFTKWDDSTFTIDTKLEKVVTNWTYDSSTQSLVLTLADGSTVSVPLSDFITENEFTDSTTIAFTVTDHVVTATVKANSIGDSQMQTGYLTDCQGAASTAGTAATAANANKLEAEGWAVGKQGGVDVGSDSPYYHNNAKYWKEQAQAIAGGEDLVKYTSQAKTSAEKLQARTNIGLGNVDNTSDFDKPISTATQNALDDKSEVGHTHSASDITSGTLSVLRGGTGKNALASTQYTDYEYRGESLNSSDTTPTENGTIAWKYE